MNTTSVTSKGQVTIPKRVRELLGITAGSRLAFEVQGGAVRIRLVRAGASSRVEDGPRILDYSGPRVDIADLHGGRAMKKAAARARR